VKNSKRIIFKKVNDRFIVLESNIMGKLSETLSHELILLLFKNVRNIKLLKFLVGKVYKELLKRIIV